MRHPSLRALRLVAVVALVFVALPGTGLACPVCFQNADTPMVDAARVGMFLLLGVVVVMQGAFGAFFLYLRRQARRAASRALENETLEQEWSRLQQEWAGDRSMNQ